MSLHHPATEILSKSVFYVLSFICWQHVRDRFILTGIWKKLKQTVVRTEAGSLDIEEK